jgi:hypothetical protein
MNKSLLNYFFIVSLFVSFALVANGQAKKMQPKVIEPTAKEAIKQIFSNGNLLLKSYPSCESYAATKENVTISDYFANFLSFQAEPGKFRIDFTFTQEKNKRNELIWVCDLVFRTVDEPETSSDGFRFKMRNSDRKLISQSLMCIGVG